uniref:Secreted protein n=1 Tax=Heterorhabditis bacteriophora TaxID=37862 RepID=A0A1I7X2I9_HETBA
MPNLKCLNCMQSNPTALFRATYVVFYLFCISTFSQPFSERLSDIVVCSETCANMVLRLKTRWQLRHFSGKLRH